MSRSAAHNSGGRAARRRAFTLLEMVLATALSSMVMIAAFGMFGFIRLTDQRLSERFEAVAEDARAHATLRRAMRSIVAAPEPADLEAELRRRQREQAARGDEVGVSRLTDEARARLLGTPRFSLGPLDPEQDEDDSSGPWRLGLTLTSSPILAESEGGGLVRGAFDKVRTTSGWRLQWTPIDPPGDPTVLADDLRDVFWASLVLEGYVDRYDAHFLREMPRAVRIVLFGNDGRVTDWMFEPGVVVGEEG